MKKCNKCNSEKPFDEFHRKNDGYRDRCKDCAKDYHRKHYLANKQKYIKQAASWKGKMQKMVNEIKNVPCKDCGIKYPPPVMEFDHVNRKTKDGCVSKMVGHTSVEKLMLEIKKCEIVCANCHRLRTMKSWSA